MGYVRLGWVLHHGWVWMERRIWILPLDLGSAKRIWTPNGIGNGNHKRSHNQHLGQTRILGLPGLCSTSWAMVGDMIPVVSELLHYLEEWDGAIPSAVSSVLSYGGCCYHTQRGQCGLLHSPPSSWTDFGDAIFKCAVHRTGYATATWPGPTYTTPTFLPMIMWGTWQGSHTRATWPTSICFSYPDVYHQPNLFTRHSHRTFRAIYWLLVCRVDFSSSVVSSVSLKVQTLSTH